MGKTSTICFLFRGSRLLLGFKKRGKGAGKWNGYGGKSEGQETPAQNAVREIQEETGQKVRVLEGDLEEVARITFFRGNILNFNSHVFFVRNWTGDPEESEEMRPGWFPRNAPPYRKMWPGVKLWLPLVLSGKKITAVVRFDSEETEVEEFSWEEVAGFC
jgi:8-oxo-dGTP pyrophosphatase MutT (NUDIX family)